MSAEHEALQNPCGRRRGARARLLKVRVGRHKLDDRPAICRIAGGWKLARAGTRFLGTKLPDSLHPDAPNNATLAGAETDAGNDATELKFIMLLWAAERQQSPTRTRAAASSATFEFWLKRASRNREYRMISL